MGGDLDYFQQGQRRYIRPDEALVFKKFADWTGMKHYEIDEETGRMWVPPVTYAFFKTLPGTTQFTDWSRATWANPGWEAGAGEGIEYGLKSLTRFGAEVPYSGKKEALAMQGAMERQYQQRRHRGKLKASGPAVRDFDQKWREGRAYTLDDAPELPPKK
tara:strand:- start:263 stop:742 length:480 start_codon:yes stop_codon:yes gene_type:complete